MTESLQTYPIQITQDLIWADMDAYQHVNNATFFRYFEDARMAYFEKIGINALMHETNLGPILASTQANFKTPLVYPDTLSIGAKISSAEGKKICMQYIVFSHAQERIAAEGEALVIYYDYNKQLSCNIPEKILNAIKQLETY